MEFHLLFSPPTIILIATFMMSLKVRSQEIFSAVTEFGDLNRLYLEVRAREPHLKADVKADRDAKKRICQSIAESGYFTLNKKDPIDMDTIYDELKMRVAKEEAMSFNSNVFFSRVMSEYTTKTFPHVMEYTYPNQPIQIHVVGREELLDESAFACMLRQRENYSLVIYYVSNPYNVNPVPANGPIMARFLCLAWSSTCELWAIAEEPAVAYTSKEYPIEDIYLRLKKFYSANEQASEDPLCGLSKAEKLRVCTSALSSSAFVGEVIFFPNIFKFKDNCELNKVSFRTINPNAEIKVSDYHEWMLPCPISESPAVSPPAVFYISRAYHANHGVVYSRKSVNDGWFIENISGNIAAIIERNLFEAINEESTALPPENLVNLLRTLRYPEVAENSRMQEN